MNCCCNASFAKFIQSCLKELTEKKPINVTEYIKWTLASVVLFTSFKGFLGLDFIGAFIYTLCIIAPASIIVDKSLSKEEKQKIWVIFIVAFFVICIANDVS